MTYSNQTIWITGASSGIGEAFAEAYSKKGATLILSARNVQKLEALKSRLEHPEKAFVVPLDLEDHESLSNKVEQVLSDYRIDLLINNAGVSQRSLAKDTDITVYKRLMDVNYLGTIILTKQVLNQFLKHNHGKFVVVSSVAGKFGVPVRSGYSASKFALHGFFEALRAELKDTKIVITMICPGYIRTDISLKALTANGQPQNTLDDAQKNGMATDLFTKKAIKAIEGNKAEVYIGGFKETKLAVWVSRMFPSVFRKIIAQSKVT